MHFKRFSNLTIKDTIKPNWAWYFDIEQAIWKMQIHLMQIFSALTALQKLINSVLLSSVSKPLK